MERLRRGGSWQRRLLMAPVLRRQLEEKVRMGHYELFFCVNVQ